MGFRIIALVNMGFLLLSVVTTLTIAFVNLLGETVEAPGKRSNCGIFFFLLENIGYDPSWIR